jgi:hypothetical protein
MTDSQHLDDLIDTAARQLTAGDPPAHLRTRVLARLDERRSMSWMWIAAPVCAVAVVVAAVTIGFHDRAASRIAQRAEPGAVTLGAPKLPSVANASEGGPNPQAPNQQPSIGTRGPRVTASAPSVEDLAWQARALPALEPPNPLTLDEIQPAALEIRPLVTTPLTVPAIGQDEDTNQKGPRP